MRPLARLCASFSSSQFVKLLKCYCSTCLLSMVMKLCNHLLTTKWNSLVWYGYEVWIAHDALCVYKEKCEWTLPWMLACGFIKILFVKAIIGSDSRPSSVTIMLPALSLRPHSNHQSSSHTFSHTLIRSWIQILLPLKSPPRGPVVRKNEKSLQSKPCRSVTLSYCEWIELGFFSNYLKF